MATTRTTIWGVTTLLLVIAGLYAFRSYQLHQRNACQRRLQAISAALDSYSGKLPSTPAELRTALRAASLPEFERLHYRMNPDILSWKQGDSQPFLWDPAPHPFVNGIHVLYTDGNVRLLQEMPNIPVH